MLQTTSTETLKSLYHQLLRIRKVEERIVELYPEQQMRCPVHLCIGQEAVAVGICHHLRPEDIVMSAHRSHGHYLAKGGDLKQFFAEIYGKETGCCQGRGGSMHLIDLSVNFWGATPIVGGSIPVAAGIAFADTLQKRDTMAVVFFGDAAVEEGVFHETLNFAALRNLPILFVCENNLYSTATHIKDRQPQRPICELAKGHGILAGQEDGNDMMKVYEAGRRAAELIRAGEGPMFIEFLTYRFREHCGPNYDIDLGYRTQEELEDWQARCPVAAFRQQLLADRVMTEAEFSQVAAVIEQEIEEAVAFAQKSPFSAKALVDKDVYAP